MNNNLRKILTAAACITFFGNISQGCFVEAATINDRATADGNTGKLNIKDFPMDRDYTWKSGAADSVVAELETGGRLTVSNYNSSSIKNGILKATAGDLTVATGTLTIDSSSFISKSVQVTTDAGTLLQISGGSVSLDEAISGDIKLTSGTLLSGNNSINGETTVNGGTAFFETVTLGDNVNISGGTTSFTNSTVNSDLMISSGNTKFNNSTINRNATHTGGTTTYTNSDLNSNVDISNGTANFDSSTLHSNVDISNGTAHFDSSTLHSNVNISGGTADFNAGTVNNIQNSGGNLSFNNTSKTGIYTQTSGSTSIKGSGFNIDSGDYVSGGTINFGDGSTTTTKIDGTITSSAGVNINHNANVNITSGNVELDSGDKWNGNVNVSGGSLALVGINKSSSGVLKQTGGNVSIEGENVFYLNNSNDSISGGTLNVGSETTNGSLTVTHGTISQGANVNVATNGTLEVAGGNVTLDSGDRFNGIVGVTGGDLQLNNVNKSSGAIFVQNSGTSTVTGTLDLNNSFDSVEGGKMNIGNGSSNGEVIVNKGTITNDAQINITSSGKLNVQGGETTLGSNDTWDGTIEYNGGSLALNNITKNGAYIHHDGTLDVTGQNFDLNNVNDLIDGGTVNIGDGASKAKMGVSKGTITEDATININDKATLAVSGGNVTLDKDDTWIGDVNVSDGNLALVGIKKEGTYSQSGGSTTVTGKNFALDKENDYISGGELTIGNGFTASELVVSQGAVSKDAAINIKTNSTLNVTGGNVEYGSGGKWEGNINISSGNLTFHNATKDQTGTFTQTGGKTTVIGEGLDLDNSDDIVTGGTLNIGNKTTASSLSVSQGYIDTETNVHINRNGKLNVSGGEVELDAKDTWHGDINVSDGTLTLTDINKKSSGKFTQTGGKTTITGDVFELNNEGDKISGGTLDLSSVDLEVSKGTIEQGARVNLNADSNINISGGLVAMDNTDKWDGNINVNGGSLALIGINNKNGVYTQTKGTTTVTESGFDMNNAADKITGGNLNVGDGTTISDMSVSQGTIGPNTNVNITNNGTLKVTGGTVNLNSNTTYNGSIDMASGTLNMESVTKNPDGTYAQNGGTATVNGTGFDMNNVQDSVAGGTFNIGNGTTLTQVGVSKGTIKSEAVTNINTNSTLNISGGGVSLNDNDNWNGRVNISSGKLNLMDARKNTDGVLLQTGGVTTVTGTSFELNNTYDRISGGTLNIGTEQEPSTMSSSRGTIEAGAEVNLANNSTLNLSGSNITINENDNWNGNINLTNGNLNLAGTNKNPSGTLTQTGGKTTVTGQNTLNNENDIVSGGNLIIGTSTNGGELNVENGTIEKGASVTINETGTLNVKGGQTTLDGANDRWNGKVNISDGTLNINNKLNKVTNSTATFNQTGGEVNIDDAKLTLNTSDSKIVDGTVNISQTGNLTINNQSENKSVLNSTGGKLSIGKLTRYALTGGTIDKTSAVTVEKASTLALDGAETNVSLDGKNDSTNGNIELKNGTLNLSDKFNKTTTADGSYIQTGGTLNAADSTLTLNDNQSVISDGTVNLTENSELSINNNRANSSVLNSTNSKFSVKNGSQYELTGGTVDTDSKITIEKNATLVSNGKDTNITLNGKNDIVEGSVELKDGTLYITDDLTKVTDASGHYIQSGGQMTMSDAQLTLADEKSVISGGDVNLTNHSNLTVTNAGGDITGGNIVIDDTSVLNYLAQKGLIQFSEGEGININTSGLINMANNVRTNSTVNNLTVNNLTGDGQTNFAVDLYARNSAEASTDTITANSINVAQSGEKGTIRISDWNLNGDIFGYDAPIDKHIRLGKIFKSDDIGQEVQFAATDKEIFTPIGYYKLNASSANDGNYSLDLTRFNPQVFRGQVATAASYMNQLVINDTLFNRAQIRRYGASYDELFKNKTAIIDATASYERTLKEGNIWTEAFGNFETLKMNHGLNKVRNNSYGFIVGGDFGLRELKNGWKWMPTAYIAYNGGHQTYNKVGMWENGGQIGFMNSFSKDNFMETALLYGGLYGTEMNIAGHSEDAFNYFIGLASKSSYDWKLGSHFKIQPSLTLAYNMFGKQNWHSDYGQMGMTSGFLNGFNVAPGVNFIWQQETWNMYATIAYAWNFFSGLDGTAGHVDLPDMRMKTGYLTWGLGMTKSISDRTMMYAQATVRNIGRTGIICQGGINWRL